jgi:hypothetical protein
LLAACITESPIANTPLGSLVPEVVVADTAVVVVAGATVVGAATVDVGDTNVVVVVWTSAVVVVTVDVVVVAAEVVGRGGSVVSGVRASPAVTASTVGFVSTGAGRIVVDGPVIAGWAPFSRGKPQAVARRAIAMTIMAARSILIDPVWCLTT